MNVETTIPAPLIRVRTLGQLLRLMREASADTRDVPAPKRERLASTAAVLSEIARQLPSEWKVKRTPVVYSTIEDVPASIFVAPAIKKISYPPPPERSGAGGLYSGNAAKD